MGDGEASDRAERALCMLGTLLLGALPTETQAPQRQNSEGHATAAHMKDAGDCLVAQSLLLGCHHSGKEFHQHSLPPGYSLTHNYLPVKVKVSELRWWRSGADDRRDPGNFCSKGPALSFWSSWGRGGKLSTSSLWPCLQIHTRHTPHTPG